jgi:hypothetical protein
VVSPADVGVLSCDGIAGRLKAVATSDTPRAHAGRLWCGAGTAAARSIVCSVRTIGSSVSPPATFRLGEPIRDDVEGFKIVAVSEVAAVHVNVLVRGAEKLVQHCQATMPSGLL